MAMKPLGGGDFEMATPPATTTTNHLLGGRNLCLVLLWQKCLITEWFSWLIIKTALDRNQRVVFTNTCVFYRRPHQHTANQKNRALL